MRDFKTIKAWQRAHALGVSVHRLARGFSRAGHSHLRSQLMRAADSISTNIVEECGAATNKELARYL
ncbi:MAG TPA: four helix bundle protein [Gemmatimonadaceae bacterium]